MLHQTLHISHAQQLADEGLRREPLEVVQVFARTQENDRRLRRGNA
jgi:hypothetical protein